MGIVKDIQDLVTGVSNVLHGKDFKFRTTRNSISRKSSDSVLQFPVICSSALSADDLMMVTKALEREYAQFIRIAASLDEVIDLRDKKSVQDAKLAKIRSLHQNMGGGRGQGVIDYSGGKLSYSENTELSATHRLSYTSLREDMERKNIELLQIANEDLNMSILNDMTNTNNRNYYNFSEANLDAMNDCQLERYGRQKQIRMSIDRDKREAAAERRAVDKDARERAFDAERLAASHNDEVRKADAHLWASNKNDRDIEAHELNMTRTRQSITNDEERMGLARDQHQMQRDRAAREIETFQNTVITRRSGMADQLLPSDAKKANELVPTMLDLTFLYNTGSTFAETHIMVGIKSVAHLVTSDEMMTNVATAVKEKRHFFRFLQWTTGEISTVKDWILAKDKIKGEVSRQRSGKESVWWRRMKNRTSSDQMHRFSFSNKDVLPNSTLVLTMDEVEMIANNYNINILKDTKAVMSLFKTFFLLGLVIVDPASDLAYFAFDGNEEFQIQSFRSLEKENSSAADMKSLISLVDKNKR